MLRRVPTSYPTIQAAIDASANGDSVAVAPGTYTGVGNEWIDFHGKAVVLFSEEGAPVTTIQGESRIFVFYSGEPPATCVRGFTLQGFTSAVYCDASSPTIVDCVVRDAGDYGSSVSVFNSSAPTLVGCQFVANRSYVSGGAVVADNSSLTIKDCSFTRNRSVPFDNSAQGGALLAVGGSLILEGCSFSDNKAIGPTTDIYYHQGVGGALNLQGTDATITDCIFTGNQAISESGFGSGTGGAVAGSGAMTFRRCSFSDNGSEGVGGAVAWGYDSPLFEDCTFSRNAAFEGGALSISSAVTIRRCIFTSNNAVAYGGAVQVVGASPSFYGSLFANNTARAGGALSAYASQVALANCTMVSNSATDSTIGGGGIHANSSAITIDRSIIAFSTSGEAFSCAGDCCHVTMSCSDVYGNAAGDYIGCLIDDVGVNGNFSDDPQFCDLPAGNYTLEAGSPCAPENSPAGCALIGAFPVGCNTTGASEGSSANDLTPWLGIHPNPVRSRAQFSFDGSGRDSLLEIYDAQGRLLDVIAPKGHRADWMPSRSIPAGVYFARLRDPHATRVVKFLLIP